jgi:ribosome maturation factor RimP
MRKENIAIFLNKKVKLVKDGGFVLYGEIIDIDEDCLFFKTDKATSVIKYDVIQEITPITKEV